jgi:hypothetical protein
VSLLTSLVAYWKMDEASGDALDAYSTNNLTDTGTVPSTIGKIGTARKPTTGKYFTTADSAALSTGDIDFTIQVWVGFDTLPGAANQFVMSRWDGATKYEYALYYDFTANRMKFIVSSDGTAGPLTTVTANTFGVVTQGIYYCVHAWHDSINNVLGIAINDTADTSAYSAGLVDTPARTTIGRNDDGSGNPMTAAIDEVGFWKRMLTPTERTNLYNGGSGLAFSSFGGGGGGAGLPFFMQFDARHGFKQQQSGGF